MGTADAERLLLLEGTPLADLAELLAVIKQDVGCLHELIAERRIAEVGACHAVMDPPRRLRLPFRHILVDVGAHVRQEGDDIVVRDGLDCIDLFLVEVGMVADPLGLFLRYAGLSDLGMRLAGQDFDLLPDGILVLEGEDMSHLGAGIAVNHGNPFCEPEQASPAFSLSS